jgi:hypothetical protein
VVEYLQPPFISDDDGDIETYPSVSALCGAVEAIDVADGVYEAFDSRGQRVRLRAVGYDVTAEIDDDVEPDPAELERRLRRYVLDVGPARVGLQDLESTSLAEIVDALVEFQTAPPRSRGWFRRGRARS